MKVCDKDENKEDLH